MSRLRKEEGSAVIVAILILFVILGVGFALLATANGQQRSAYNQQSSESAFSVAEAALNAQIYQLSLQWPTTQNMPAGGYPATGCNASSNGAAYCPSTSDLSTAYPTNSQTCPAGTTSDAWSNSGTTNGWTTYVRDAGPSGSGTQSLFASTTEKTMPAYDASGTNTLWVRAVGTVNCHTVVVVSKISEQLVALNFPQTVLSANGFEISDNGNKTVLNTADNNGNTSQVSLRCVGLSPEPPSAACAQYGKSQQVAPGPTYSSPPTASPTLSPAALQALKGEANANGTYFPAGTNCSSIAASQLQGAVVYIEGGNSTTPCNISVTSNGTINSPTAPGLLILVNGTLNFGGNLTYYGVIYGANAQQTSGDVVTLGGTSTVVGGIDIDGLGTVSLGSSGNGVNCPGQGGGNNKCGDLQFATSAFPPLTTFAGAAGAPNSFRQLPAGQ